MVIWITGFSSAGKTTVARKLKARLTPLVEAPIVHLDGDDIRHAFGEHFGYSRGDRINLAFAYFRMCNVMAEQGVIIIISAVAMYREVFEWTAKHIDGMRTVYLRVPENELRGRDRGNKNVYDKIDTLSELYDVPPNPHLIVDNFGDNTPDHAVGSILEMLDRTKDQQVADHGRRAHWASFYRSSSAFTAPSNFSRAVASSLRPNSFVVDVGCGNGRDTVFFAELGHRMIGLDVSREAIDLCRKSDMTDVQWINSSLPDLREAHAGAVDAVYCRFVLHAVSRKEEVGLLEASYDLLKLGGKVFIECRSINDQSAKRGEFVSATERIDGHYRRFIVPDVLRTQLEYFGFRVEEMRESRGFAVSGNEDPMMIRITATKP